MIEFINVEFEYGAGQKALSGVSEGVAEGEFVAVIGHNGSGKSTLAKLVNALLLPSSGDCLVCSFNTKDADKTLSIRQNVGMVFQNPDNQLVTTIVEDDVAFGPENLGVERAEIRRRVDEALESVSMSKYAKFAPHTLSGGQKQRIAIAGILAMKPRIIVFDEPTAMLDPSGRKDVIDTITKLHESGITVVLITHFMEEAALAERIVVLSDGEVKFSGTPRQVFERGDELAALGMESPFAVRFCDAARAKGIDLPLCIDEEGLVAELCRLYSTS